MGRMSVKYRVSRGSVVGSVVGQSRVTRESSRVRFHLPVFISIHNLCCQVGIVFNYLVDGAQRMLAMIRCNNLGDFFSRNVHHT